MSIKVALRHYTRYDYERSATLGPQEIRLRPAPHSRTLIKGYSLNIKPENHFINWQQDPFGNYVARIVFQEKVKYFEIDVEVIADMVVINPFDFFVEEYAEDFPFLYEKSLVKQLTPYLELNEDGPLLKELLDEGKKKVNKKMRSIDFLVAINRMVYEKLSYNIRMEPGIQSCEKTLEIGSGSCRDFAWLLVQLLRWMGLAARFVSGYLIQLKADQESLDGPSGAAQDFTDLHAWVEVYLPGAGWIGLDSTSGLFAGEGHIPLACTPEPGSAAPISGFIAEKVETEFSFENGIKRIEETPRVSKPYTEQQWEQIIAVGDKVEEDLLQNDVRLTMGGEPTFVSLDNIEAAEWNSDADGAHKRQLSNTLFHHLKESFGDGALMQYGQGKWYPGEPLPRWKLACYWRKDGRKIWNNDALLGDISKDYGYSSKNAKKFMKQLVGQINVDPKLIRPAYEDPFYFIWEEGKVPVDVDPLEVDLESSLERQKLAELLHNGMNTPVGFALPLAWDFVQQSWQSCSWTFRRKHLFLVPGNSPIGLRLPLDSITEEETRPSEVRPERSLFEEVGDLPDYTANFTDSTRGYNTSDHVFITCLLVEVRQGKLFVFFPPLTHFEHYLDLVYAVERTAEALGIPVLIEGYDPPADNRWEKFMITPDPGVIEVNVQPANNWREILKNYETLYEKARITRLTTEKFNLDGRHTGTGGGNHVTLGGSNPTDSPLLRRPDLLQSFVTFWQHHPSLSYLFSTQFIGPTSQAPRIDEGRDDLLYEMELAFQQVPSSLHEDNVPYWLVDRIFRNLLVDITGNTHRAEFCIDKLYSPDSSSGRLGILEFRGFDMPPHYRMAMVQLLLVRSLLSMFWKKPYQHKLVRWGTQLHDKFLLPHHCYKDMTEVVKSLREAGYAFDISWFDPFFSFRFPFLGELQVDDIHIELKMAIEPWHVLGEEMSSTGTARFVDSSLERVQVKVTGLTDSRYHLLCNGLRVPLKNTGIHGEYVSGIRYRAWQPPSALHPTLGIDTPLVFDLYDTWAQKSIGACKYHVAHPGGRGYDTFPVNSFEAESRVVSRFFDFGHSITVPEPTPHQPETVGRYVTQINSDLIYEATGEAINPEFPNTMDLRRYKSVK